MGQSYTDVGGFGDFDVEVSNPSGTIVRFTLQDDANRVTQIRLIQAILKDAIQQFLDDNRATLDDNGDAAVTGEDTRYPGDGFPNFTWVYGSKYGQIELTSVYGLDVEDTIVCGIPYLDIV